MKHQLTHNGKTMIVTLGTDASGIFWSSNWPLAVDWSIDPTSPIGSNGNSMWLKESARGVIVEDSAWKEASAMAWWEAYREMDVRLPGVSF
jgi:hypothetical protein